MPQHHDVMGMTAEWAAVYASLLLGMGGAVGATIQRIMQRRKDASPLLRWSDGYLEVVNRLNEHLWISRVNAGCLIALGEYQFDNGGSLIPDSEPSYQSPLDVRWEVGPLGTGIFPLRLRGKVNRIEVTVCSSLNTVRHRRFTVQVG